MSNQDKTPERPEADARSGFGQSTRRTFLSRLGMASLLATAGPAVTTLGQLATIGRRTGVAMVFGIKFSGFVAWALWRTIYLMKLPRLPKKLRVMVAWTLDLLFARDIEQMITLRDVEAAGQLAGRIRARATQKTSPAGSVFDNPARDQR